MNRSVPYKQTSSSSPKNGYETRASGHPNVHRPFQIANIKYRARAPVYDELGMVISQLIISRVHQEVNAINALMELHSMHVWLLVIPEQLKVKIFNDVHGDWSHLSS